MKKIPKFLFSVMCATMLFSSCANELDEELLSTVNNTESAASQAAILDTLNLEDAVVTEETSEQKAFLEAMKQMQSKMKSGRYYPDYDEYFSMNMWNIRDLAITLQARGGANTSNRFLTTNGKGKEVTLTSSGTATNQQFSLKVLPATSGIPYMIYSYREGTPLSIGQYSNNPNNKILMARNDNNGSAYSADWDLLPSVNSKGSFAIQSNSYLGQADPSNPWSIFYHVLEVRNDNKVGYTQYTKKAQQEFDLRTVAPFQLTSIEYDHKNAVITDRTPLTVIRHGQNPTEYRKAFTITAVSKEEETSSFVEKSNLSITKANWTELYRRPTVVANKLVPPAVIDPSDKEAVEKAKKEADAFYFPIVQKIPKNLVFEINGTAKANSLIEATCYLKNYSVTCNYVATLKYSGRELKIKGVWSAIIYTNVRAKADIIKCFDLDDGEELRRNIKISKTILK